MCLVYIYFFFANIWPISPVHISMSWKTQHPISRINIILTNEVEQLPTAMLHLISNYFIWLTGTEWEGAIPRSPLPPQAGEHLWAFQGVAWVTAIRHSAPCKVTLVFTLVAKLGNTWILAFHQLKTLTRERESLSTRIRRALKRWPLMGFLRDGGQGEGLENELQENKLY